MGAKLTMNKRILIIPIIAVFITIVIFIVLALANNSRILESTEDRRIVLNNGEQVNMTDEKLINLYISTYSDLMSTLSNADRLPEFEVVELVDEVLNPTLSEECRQELVRRLDEMFPYGITLSRGHERSEHPKSEAAYVYLWFMFDRAFISTDCNEAKTEGFINNSDGDVVDLNYTYYNGAWELVKSEIIHIQKYILQE